MLKPTGNAWGGRVGHHPRRPPTPHGAAYLVRLATRYKILGFGVMPGPVPKRSDQRRRRNTQVRKVTVAPATVATVAPDCDPSWHPVAQRFFDSLKTSGQSAFYTDSDWAMAWVLAESMSRELQPQPVTLGRGEDAQTVLVSLPPKAASLAAWIKAMSCLLVSEGDRRRVSLELQQPDDPADDVGGVAWLEDARRRLGYPS